jgi:hypothetical protein
MSDDPFAPKPGDVVPTVTSGLPRLLTPDEMNSAVAWINSHARSTNDGCQVCGDPNNSVQPSIVKLDGGINPHNPSSTWMYPSIITICNNCGFTRHFNAIVMGLFSVDKSPKGSS